MALSFPANPASQTPVNTYSPTSSPAATDNGITYTWTGEVWEAATSGGGGTSLWARDGTTLKPANAGDDLDDIGNVVCTADIQGTSQNGGQLAGFRNLLINSGFQIDQRNLSGVSLAATKYCLDRWVAASGATVTQLNVCPGGFPNAISYVGGNTTGYIRQAIELPGTGTQNAPFDTSGLDWTFSVYSDVAPQFEAFYADDNIPNLINRTDWVTLQTLTSTGKTIFSNATGTLTQYSITINNSPAPAASNNCLIIAFRGGGFYAGPQFEPGPVATPFEHRPIGTELALCQRYFQTFAGIGAPVQDFTDTFRNAQALRPVKMRVKPTESATMNNCTFRDTAASTDSYINIMVQPTTSNVTAYISDYTADAEL